MGKNDEKSPIDGYISCEILGDGIYLTSGMPEVLVSFLSKFPVLSLVILYSSAMHVQIRLRLRTNLLMIHGLEQDRFCHNIKEKPHF